MFEPTAVYSPNPHRYDTMTYNRAGASGLKLPAVSLGFWHNFGDITPFDQMKSLVFTAFDNGITHFDLANNYGPEPGQAEKNCGLLLTKYFKHHRDELIISTKAGYEMWAGPYGDLGSRKYLLASLDQSLERLGLDYVDIFYHHHPDPETPLEETMGALAQAVNSGKALYAGLSNYDGSTMEKAAAILAELHVPYRDQSEIGNYDSTLLQSDYTGLFRDRTYSGLDRIASANQVTTGLTSRVYDAAAVERFNISVGQIYYFTESRTGDDNINWENNDTTGSLVWAGDTYWRIADEWGLRGGIQYDTRLDNVATGNGTIEYRRDENRLVQLNYRYASPEYIQATLPSYSTAAQYKQGISQVGMTASWPIVDRWSVVGAYYYDTNTRKAANQMLGVQYNSCCYAIRLGYERKVNGWNSNDNGGESKYDNTFGINIELRGLSSNYGLGTQQMLRSNILPYQSSL